MLVPRLPTRDSTAALKQHLESGARDLSFQASPGLRDGVVVERTLGGCRWRVEVRGERVLAARAPRRGRGLFARTLPALVLDGVLDPQARLVTGALGVAALREAGGATFVANDLRHLAVVLGDPALG